jgi:hypothetical protein
MLTSDPYDVPQAQNPGGCADRPGVAASKTPRASELLKMDCPISRNYKDEVPEPRSAVLLGKQDASLP